MDLDMIARRGVRSLDAAAAFGVTAPRPLADAIAAHAAAVAYEPPVGPDVNGAALIAKPAEVADLIAGLAAAARDRVHYDQARAEVLDRLGRRVAREVADAAPGIIAALAPVFTDTAAKFTVLVGNLPAGWQDFERLVASGPEAVSVFTSARELAGTLEQLRGIRDEFAHHSNACAGGDPQLEAGTRYTAVRNAGSARRVAQDGFKAGPLGVFGTLLAVDGVEGLHWLPLDEHGAYLAKLPATEGAYRQVENNGFGGVRFVPA